jgi:hypothetical protein
MYQGGTKGVEIVVALGHPKSSVSIVLKEFERRGSEEHPKSIRCLQKLSKRSIRIIFHKLVQDQQQSLWTLQIEVASM